MSTTPESSGGETFTHVTPPRGRLSTPHVVLLVCYAVVTAGLTYGSRLMATTFHDSNIELSFFSRLVVHPYYFPSLWLLSTATIIGYVRRSNIRGEPINLNVISAIMKTAWALAGLSAIFGLFLPAARLMALD